jgi:ribonuclease P protein component
MMAAEPSAPVDPAAPVPDRRFRRQQHIRQRADFKRVYDRGRKYQGRYMMFFSLARDGQPTRLGIAATRKMGAAVERNRAKRRVREMFRLHPAPPGFDIVVVPRRGLIDAPFASIEAEYVATIGRLRAGTAAR